MINPQAKSVDINSWFDDYEIVTLPSGKPAGLRQVDILYILSDDGDIPNFLLDQIGGHISGVRASAEEAPEEHQMSMDDLKGIQKLLDKLVLACWASPPVSNDPAKVESREAISTSMISLGDKMALFTWAMGGATAFEKAGDFLKEQAENLESVQAGGEIRLPTKPATQNS